MIYVNQEQLDQVQYLLEQAAKGNHILFDEKTLRRVAPQIDPSEMRNPTIEKAEQLLEQLILCPTIKSKKVFLENLESSMYDEVAKVFFSIVQNSAHEHQGFTH